MDMALVVARLLLAVVFAVAGVAKLADRAGARQAVGDFGAPMFFATPLAIILPLAELAVAVALIPRSTAWWGALGALALLLLFIAAIAVNLARGRKPDCRCFGQLHSSPVGWRTMARNAVLAAVAAFVVWQGRGDPGRSAVAWLGDLTSAELAAAIAGAVALLLLAVLGWFVLNLLRQQGRLLLRIEALEAGVGTAEQGAAPGAAEVVESGLAVGAEAPTFRLSGIYGETLTLDSLRAAGKPVLLLFTDPNCGPCNALTPEIGGWQRAHSAELTITVISRGTPDENRAKSVEHGLTNVLLQEDNEVADAYRVSGTPGVVVVHPDGTIGSSVAAGAEAIRAVVARTVGSSNPPPEAPPPLAAPSATNGSGDSAAIAAPTPVSTNVGDPAPSLKLPDLDGKTIDFRSLRGRNTLVLFWNPGCGFCAQMLDDLKAWEANPPKGAPKLLVVSTGTVEENRAMGVRSPVVLDPSFSAGTAFGASGTPSAVLIDAKGKVASELAVGAPAVLALAGAEPTSSGTTGAGATVKLGDPVPALELPDVTGGNVDLSSFKGTPTLLVFWNPQCGFCSEMIDDLRAWEAQPPEDAPTVVLVSAGTPEANLAMGLRSPVLLDQQFKAGSTFGANGTPMAVLIDAEGRVASDVVAGGPAVLALAGARHGAGDPS